MERNRIMEEQSESKAKHAIGGFGNLARTVSAKWKNVDTTLKLELEALANKDKERYNREVEEWKLAMFEEATAAMKEREAATKANLQGSDTVNESPVEISSVKGSPAHTASCFETAPLAFERRPSLWPEAKSSPKESNTMSISNFRLPRLPFQTASRTHRRTSCPSYQTNGNGFSDIRQSTFRSSFSFSNESAQRNMSGPFQASHSFKNESSQRNVVRAFHLFDNESSQRNNVAAAQANMVTPCVPKPSFTEAMPKIDIANFRCPPRPQVAAPAPFEDFAEPCSTLMEAKQSFREAYHCPNSTIGSNNRAETPMLMNRYAEGFKPAEEMWGLHGI